MKQILLDEKSETTNFKNEEKLALSLKLEEKMKKVYVKKTKI